MVGVPAEGLTKMVGVNEMEAILYTSRPSLKVFVTPPYLPPCKSYWTVPFSGTLKS